jgi:hypothetical protein
MARLAIDQGGNMSATEIHTSLATTCILYAFILAAWGIWRYLRKEGLNGSYWGALVIGEGLFLAQGLIGVTLWLSGLRPAQLLHILYGVVSVLTIPAVFIFTQGRDSRKEMGVYGVALLFLFGIALRAVSTAR